MTNPIETYVAERLKESNLEKSKHKRVKEKFMEYAKKYQRKNTKDAIIFICLYMIYTEDKQQVTLLDICEKLCFNKQVIKDAVKLAKTEKWCEIEEVDVQTVIKSISEKFSFNCLTEEVVMNYYDRITALSNLSFSSRPHTLICAIIYYLITKTQKFDKIFFTDEVEISVVTLDRVTKQIKPIFEN